jgi:hypothetical protein
MVVTLVTITTSCMSQNVAHKRKVERAKKRIEKIINRYPELKTITETKIVTRDTQIHERVIEYRDTIYTTREVIDSSFYFALDSTYRIQQENIEALFQFTKDNKFNFKIIKQPEAFYIHDTIRVVDTTFNNNTVITQKQMINTKPNFWFNLWIQFKNWILALIVMLLVSIIVGIIFKILFKR